MTNATPPEASSATYANHPLIANRPCDSDQITRMAIIREAAGLLIDRLQYHCPENDSGTKKAIDHVISASMWANRAISRDVPRLTQADNGDGDPLFPGQTFFPDLAIDESTPEAATSVTEEPQA